MKPEINNDIPVILAVADSLASSGSLTDAQRQEALEAIAFVRASSSRFLDKAEQILEGKEETPNAELHATASLAVQINTSIFKVEKTLWILEDAVFQRRNKEIAAMGKEGSRSNE
jgi:hypothetical protein